MNNEKPIRKMKITFIVESGADYEGSTIVDVQRIEIKNPVMNEKPIRYEVEGKIYESTPATEQSIFRKMRKLNPESIVIVREWDGSILDELPMDALV